MKPPTSRQLEEGVRLFNDGRYFEAHDAWEAAWKHSRGDARQLLQGLVQAAAGLFKAKEKSQVGAVRLLGKAIDTLYGLSEQEGLAVDVSALVEALAALRAELERGRTFDDLSRPVLRYIAPDERAESLGGGSTFSAVQCPYCGEEVEVAVEALGAAHEQYVQDCSVCCRPWRVMVSRAGSEVEVALGRDDD